MSKDDVNSTFNFDEDPEFSENFYKNIEMAFGDSNVETPNQNTIEAGNTDAAPISEPSEAKRSNADITDVQSTDSKRSETDGPDFEFSDVTAGKQDTSDHAQTMEENLPEPEKTKQNNAERGNTERMENKDHLFDDGTAQTSQETPKLSEEAEEAVDNELQDIHASLARKICEEMDHIGVEQAKQKKKSKWLKIQKGILLTFLCLAGVVFFFGFTKPGNQLLLRMGVNLTGTIWSTWTGNFEDTTDVVEDVDYIDEEDTTSTAKEVDPVTIIWPTHPGEGRHEEGVYNILLLGEEAIGMGDSRGRTDVIVIATMNTNTKELHLTSLMRDNFVQIPGYKDNKLNSAYEKGGLDLLYETISLNFDIKLDGCVMVNFNNFEKIIDRLGGLDITLTEGEAKYLNTTNYISDPANRHVVAGKNHMNGNQVLGYARVRKRATITGNNNDYGRTDRHRIVLNAIFDKYKTKSKVELASVMFDLLPMITTDIDSKNFEMLLNSFIDMGTTEMSQLRIPADGAFDNAKVRGMDVLIPDLQKNIEILHTFIFGADPTPTVTPAPDMDTTGSTNTTGNSSSTTNDAAAAGGSDTSSDNAAETNTAN